MRFNNTIYKTFVAINFVTFIFISFIGVDYLLPREIAEEVVAGTKRKVLYMPSGHGGRGMSSFSGGREMPSDDTDYLQTKSFRFQIDRIQKPGIYRGDSVKVYQGWLSGLVFEAAFVKNGLERKITRNSTIFGYLAFIPIITFLLGLAGVLNRKRNLLSVEIGAMNLLLLVLIFYLYK